jgi:hypothetical protein
MLDGRLCDDSDVIIVATKGKDMVTGSAHGLNTLPHLLDLTAKGTARIAAWSRANRNLFREMLTVLRAP